MNNRFVILIGSYNNAAWTAQNLESVLSQTHKNFKILYYNAASTDKTKEIVEQYSASDPRVKLYSTEERNLKSWFFANVETFDEINDNDIVCVLDGDDFLANEEVLNYLNEVYNKTNCWMTYGGMVVWDGGDTTQEPFPQNSEAPLEVKQNKLYRQDLWRYSHLRTCRGFLWKKVNKKELISDYDGQYMTLEDLVLMYGFLEMCPADKIFRVDQNVYIWNNTNANASRGCVENKVNNIGAIYESEIRRRPKYKELAIVSPTLAGGLGNQMFEVAAAASLANDNNALLAVNPNEHILPNQGRNVKNYLENIFGKILVDENPAIKEVYTWEPIYYKEIPFKPNVKLRGHYQSFKYFDHNREYIKQLFTLPNKYSFDLTAIQVRRGDYWKFPEHHPLLTPEYYIKAVKKLNCKEIAIFSDDIQWCQTNLKFDSDVNVQYMGGYSDWDELCKMAGCQNIIISNSSFGWWAAYLNNRADKQVFVPSPWFGPALIKDGFKMEELILPEWNIIEL